MPTRPFNDAKYDLEKFVPAIMECVGQAHDDFLINPQLYKFRSRTKAGMLRDLIVERLRDWSDETSGVQYFKKGNLEWFGFENNWILRPKKSDDLYAVGVSNTDASRQFDRNEIPDSIAPSLLEGMEATMLYLGCLLTENAPDFPEISIICNNEHAEPHWVWNLAGPPPPPTLELLTPAPSTDPQVPNRVLVKEGIQKKRDER